MKKNNKILVVIDMQNDFINGSLGTKEAQNIVPNVVNKVEQYRKEENEVIFTFDMHFNDYLDTLEGRNLPVKHCVVGTKGYKIHPKINTENCNFIIKDTFGSFDLVNLINNEVNTEDIQIEVIGLCTDICVIANVVILKTAFPENKIIVDSSCCAGVTPKSHQEALNIMKMLQIEVI